MNRPTTFLKKCFDKLADRWARHKVVKPAPVQPGKATGKHSVLARISAAVPGLPKPRRVKRQHICTGGYSGNSRQRRLQRRRQARITAKLFTPSQQRAMALGAAYGMGPDKLKAMLAKGGAQ